MVQREITFVTISCVATREPSKGHPFWFHQALNSSAQCIPVDYKTIGALDQASENIIGALSHSGVARPASSVFAPWGMKDDIRRIERFVEKSAFIVWHFYEGGFREFVLALFLIDRFPNSSVLFNFNLTDPWQKVFCGSGVWSRIACRLMRHHLVRLRTRLVPFAETYETARDFSSRLGISFRPYPLFSSVGVESRARKDEKERKFDVAFFPGDETEFNLVADAIETLKSTMSELTAIVVPRWGFQLSTRSQHRVEKLQIDVKSNLLSSSEYEELYLSCKIALFPYVGEYYRHTSSGRLLDAASAGCYSLAPFGSLTGSQAAREGWGGIFWVDSLHEAISESIHSWPMFKCGIAPTPQVTLEKLLAEANKLPVERTGEERKALGKYPTFFAIFLGSGFRSWAPRVLQALQNIRELRDKQ